jgi:hypothetical protein
MGGPWKARGFDPAAWRAPAPRGEASAAIGTGPAHDHLTAVVIGYIASVLTSVVIIITLLKYGW